VVIFFVANTPEVVYNYGVVKAITEKSLSGHKSGFFLCRPPVLLRIYRYRHQYRPCREENKAHSAEGPEIGNIIEEENLT